MIPLDDPLGPAVITLLLDECPLPTKVLVHPLSKNIMGLICRGPSVLLKSQNPLLYPYFVMFVLQSYKFTFKWLLSLLLRNCFKPLQHNSECALAGMENSKSSGSALETHTSFTSAFSCAVVTWPLLSLLLSPFHLFCFEQIKSG